ncbi:hypothetical protein ISS39_10615 [Candidatus Bathyarchaeota archaeon]|nr:hypothetical protein [Candidatus Bathyarchaeota archaeon]
MIKSRALLLMILMLTMLTSHPHNAPSSTTDPEPLRIEERWLVTWGGDGYESPRRIIYDGSHLYVYGRTLSHGDGESNIFLAKYDMEGGLQWDAVWETPTLDVPWGYALEGPHIYITGTANRGEDPHVDHDVILLKIDRESGELVWNASWGGTGWEGEPGSDHGRDVEVLDGAIYVAGTTTSDAGGPDEGDILLLKFGAEGRLIWRRQYGGDATHEYGYHLEAGDGMLYVSGRFLHLTRTDEETVGEERMLICMLDPDGELIWNETYVGILNEPGGMHIDERSIYLIGDAWLSDRKGEISVMRVDTDGALDWYKLWGSRENEAAHYGLAVAGDSVYAFGGLGGHGVRNQDLSLISYSVRGELLGNHTWGSWRNESAWDMTLIGDTFYLLGQVGAPGEGVDVYLSAVGNPFPHYVDPGPEESFLQTWQIYGIVGVLLALTGYVYLWRLVDD